MSSTELTRELTQGIRRVGLQLLARTGRWGAEQKGKSNMLWAICVILLVLWLLGMVTSYSLGGFMHILLLVAIAVALIRMIQGRRVLG